MTRPALIEAIARAIYIGEMDVLGYPNGHATFDEIRHAAEGLPGSGPDHTLQRLRSGAERALETLERLIPALAAALHQEGAP